MLLCFMFYFSSEEGKTRSRDSLHRRLPVVYVPSPGVRGSERETHPRPTPPTVYLPSPKESSWPVVGSGNELRKRGERRVSSVRRETGTCGTGGQSSGVDPMISGPGGVRKWETPELGWRVSFVRCGRTSGKWRGLCGSTLDVKE